jgi:hypothetical protein
MYPELQALEDQLDAAQRDAEALVSGLCEERGRWRREAGSWCVSECLDHLAARNRVYLEAMRPVALRVRDKETTEEGRLCGVLGGFFVKNLSHP